jgi:glycosyltransferase involved in cell wall biosynthesis
MKILFVIPEYPPDFGGGIATFYGNLLPALARRGVAVTAIVGSALSGCFRTGEENGVRIIALDRHRAGELAGRFPALALTPDLCRHLGAAWAAWEQANGGIDFDLIECADWGLSFVPWLTRTDSPPVVVRLHASIGQIARYDPQQGFALTDALVQLIEARLLMNANELVTYGEGNRDWWHRHLGRDVARRFPPLHLPTLSLAAQPLTQHALVAGRIQTWKGPRTLCRALDTLGTQAPIVEWIGNTCPSLNGISTADMLAKEFPAIWGTRILPCPPLPPPLLAVRQSAARFVVVPSDWDVFNYTAAEAMSLGAIVVCSDGAGAAELIRPGVNGFTFPAGDHVALAERVRAVLALSPKDQADISAAARETIASTLSPDEVAAHEIASFPKIPPRTSSVLPDPTIEGLITPASHTASTIFSALATGGLSRIPLLQLVKYVGLRAVHRVVRRS